MLILLLPIWNPRHGERIETEDTDKTVTSDKLKVTSKKQ